MTAVVQIKVKDKLYLKNPDETELGKKIVTNSIKMIEKLGFEQFTFKKLAEQIKSTEASVYRYFESKHQLLSYLVSWYWSWLEYLIRVRTTNISDPKKKLKLALQAFVESTLDDPSTTTIDESALHNIVVLESTKAYVSKKMKSGQRTAFVESYRSLCDTVAKIIKEVNPRYKYSKALVATLIISVHRLSFYAENFPGLTEVGRKKGDSKEIAQFLDHMAFSLIEK